MLELKLDFCTCSLSSISCLLVAVSIRCVLELICLSCLLDFVEEWLIGQFIIHSCRPLTRP
jgi:hypothetical protein